MMENRNQFRNIISNVLNRSGFYYLSLIKLTQILKLLQMPQTSQPNTILQHVFTGIIKLHQKFKQKISQHIFSEKFNNISKEMKDLLYSIFIQLHQNILMKQQAIIQSMQINPYSMSMYYGGGGINPNYGNAQELNNSNYSDEMKKYLETSKMYPYYMMNSGLGHPNMPSTSLNPQIGQSMTNSMTPSPFLNNFSHHSQNPNFNSSNLNITNHSSIPFNYGQMIRNIGNKPSLPNNFVYGMNTYTTSMTPPMAPPMAPTIPSVYPSQYSSSYPTNMMNGFSQQQAPSQAYTQLLQNMEKSDMAFRHQEQGNNHSSLQSLQKRYASLNKPSQTIQKVERQKSLSKQIKQVGLSQQIKFNQTLNNLAVQTLQTKQKENAADFLPKKLPFKETKRLNIPNSQLKSCACRGHYQYQDTFTCSECQNKFHQKCLNLPINDQQTKKQAEKITDSQFRCAHCKIKTMDPLNKIEKVIGQFYLMNLFEKNFQTVINFRPYQIYCRNKSSKYQLEVRCIRSGDHIKNLQITWPDQCQIRLNNDKIVDIPALQTNSSLKKRKDYSVFIAQNVFKNNTLMSPQSLFILERMKFSLQLKHLTQEQLNNKKIRNQCTFALGIYLVEKLNADELYAKILSEQKIQDKQFLNNLMKSSQNQVEIDKITIRLIDPFSWDIIKTPVRGSKCIHAQCFDLKTFISLMYSAKNRTWKCPLCSKDSRKFMLDQYQVELLKKATQLNPTPKQVAIYKQGRIAFKIQKDSDDEEDQAVLSSKTKKIMKEKK